MKKRIHPDAVQPARGLRAGGRLVRVARRAPLIVGCCSSRGRRAAFVGVLAAAGLAVAMPAAAEENWPDDPAYDYGCADGFGVPRREGTVTTSGTGGMPPVEGFAGPGQYVCIDGEWIYLGPQGNVVYMQGAPAVTVADTTVAIAEGGTATTTGTVSYAGDGPIALSASVGTVTAGPYGTWSWSYSAGDGPAQSQTVVVTATADRRIGGTSFDLTVANVAPTVTAVTPDRTTAVVGEPVTFTGAAIDPSPQDMAAGLQWTFDGAPAAGGSVTTSFSTCGAKTVSAIAMDKDGGASAPTTSDVVTVVGARFAAPLEAGSYNLVKSGQVVPVRVAFGCDGVSVGGLSPSIQVLAGDVDSVTDAGDPAQSVRTVDASGADTTKVMRPVDGGYLYNLRVPTGGAGSVFTVRVRPFGGSSAAVYLVLKLRG